MGGLLGKLFFRQVLEILFGFQIGEQFGCLSADMLRETERASLFRNAHCSRNARPIEYILE